MCRKRYPVLLLCSLMLLQLRLCALQSGVNDPLTSRKIEVTLGDFAKVTIFPNFIVDPFECT